MPIRKKWLKWAGITIGSIVVLLIIVLLSTNYIVESKIKKVVDKFNSDSTKAYTLEIDKVSINIFTGYAKVKGLVIMPKETTIDSLKSGAIPSLMGIETDYMLIKGIGTSELLFSKALNIKRIKFNHPFFRVYSNAAFEKESDSLDNKKTVSPKWPESLKGVRVDQFQITDLSVQLFDVTDTSKAFLQLDSMSLSFYDIVVNDSSIQKPIPIEFSHFTFDTKKIAINNMKDHTLAIGSLDLDIKKKILTINNVELTPKLDRDAYNASIKYANDWIKMSYGKIQIRGLHLEQILKGKMLQLQALEIRDADVTIYRDKRNPLKPYKYQPLYMGALKKVKMPLLVDSLIFVDGNIHYQERDSLTSKYGTIEFLHTNGLGLNLTNDKHIIENNPEFVLNATTKLMGKGDLNVKLIFFLDNPYDRFTVKGDLTQLPFNTISPFLERVLLVKIKGGNIHKMSFDFSANDLLAQGLMDFHYTDLNIGVMKLKNNEKENSLMNLVVGAAVKKSNIPGTKKYAKGEIFFYRFREKAFFNYLWKCLMSGMVSSMVPIARMDANAKEKQRLKRLSQENPGKYTEEYNKEKLKEFKQDEKESKKKKKKNS
jgi:hypothetical protein